MQYIAATVGAAAFAAAFAASFTLLNPSLPISELHRVLSVFCTPCNAFACPEFCLASCKREWHFTCAESA